MAGAGAAGLDAEDRNSGLVAAGLFMTCVVIVVMDVALTLHANLSCCIAMLLHFVSASASAQRTNLKQSAFPEDFCLYGRMLGMVVGTLS